MNENLQVRILMPSDKEALMDFAKGQLAARIEDPMEREMQSWSARWRGEALDHYLALGWSFGAFVEAKLCGFSLGQPLLFFRGLTQTLWVEHLEGDEKTKDALLECTFRWARDKHFQCVLREGPNYTWVELKSARFQ
jgi:hypothetical protein